MNGSGLDFVSKPYNEYNQTNYKIVYGFLQGWLERQNDRDWLIHWFIDWFSIWRFIHKWPQCLGLEQAKARASFRCPTWVQGPSCFSAFSTALARSWMWSAADRSQICTHVRCQCCREWSKPQNAMPQDCPKYGFLKIKWEYLKNVKSPHFENIFAQECSCS